MVTSLKYGRDGSIPLELANETLVADNTQDRQAISDIGESVQQALREPLDFPALAEMVLPDDTVAIALEPGLPCAAEMVAGTVSAIMAAGVPPELIQVVRAPNDKGVTDKRLMSKVDASIASRIVVSRHDPSDRERLSFLGASRDENACYINRTLCDAEVVIPIVVQRNEHPTDCLGVHHSWFPIFSDVETQERYAKALASPSEKKVEKRRGECEEAAWMLGVQLVLQVVPAGHDRALHVLAGSPKAVWQRASQLADEAWRVDVDRRASLVVAAIGGGPEQQTWDNVVRTIDTALDAVEVDGTIAICSELKTRPGPALQKLAGAEDYEAADRAIRKNPTADSPAASRLNRALQNARVYLLSDLKENDVEDLGVAWVASADEISKLSTRYDSCLVLENAQHVTISLVDEDLS